MTNNLADLRQGLIDHVFVRDWNIKVKLGRDIQFVLFIEIGGIDPAFGLGDNLLKFTKTTGHIERGDLDVQNLARRDVGRVVKRHIKLHIVLRRLDVQQLTAGALSLLRAIHGLIGDDAEFLELLAHFAGGGRRRLQIAGSPGVGRRDAA